MTVMLNMGDALPFLVRFGLPADADANAIRRAYARELKLIDQASQAVQFQQLREAYEAALYWAGRGAGPGICQSAAPESPASQVYEQFLTACVPLRQKERLRDLPAWEDVLRRHLADPGLLDLSASLNFETKIAASLAAGWTSGNETLFLVAASVFEWESDSRRVQQLGTAGIVIAQTLEQQYLFDCQDEAAYKVSRSVLVGLRLNVPPLNMRLRMEMAHLESMLQYFPELIAVTAGTENVERWRALYGELRPPATPESVQPIAFAQHRTVSRSRAVLPELSVPLTIILTVLALVRFYFVVNQG
jgi:hypothetical protein